jgi:HAMP domain-containing protein
MESSGTGDVCGTGCDKDTTRAVHKSKVGLELAGFRPLCTASRYQIPTKLTIPRFDHGDTSAQCRRHRRDPYRRMRYISLSLPFSRLVRLLTSISVRTRIIVLALIPVLGFLANGLTYFSGEGAVGTAFETVKHSAGLADASRYFKSAIEAMRIIVKDFSANPNNNLVVSFEQAHALALQSLDAIAASIDRRQAENIAGLRKDVIALRDTFTELVREQKTLGFDENSGLRNNLREAGNAVERIINENMTWLAEADAGKLMMMLLTMRTYEAEYRLNPRELIKQKFLASYKKFNDTFALVDGTAEMKDSLEHEVNTYADTFTQWIDRFDHVYPLHAVIDIDSQSMLPRADEIIERARQTAEEASSGLTASQAHTRTGIIVVGIAMVAFGLGFSWLIGRSITQPLHGLAGVMQQLAAGDTSARIPATNARDEIGEMARTVIVFRDNMIEREKLAAIQTDAGRAQAQRNDTIAARSVHEARNELERSQQGRRYHVGRCAHRRATRRRRIRQCDDGRRFGRGIGGLDRRDRLAGREIHRRGGARGIGSPAHRHHHVGTRQRRHPHRRGGGTNPGDRRADQPARAQRHHRGGPRRGIRQGFRGSRLGSEIAGRTDRESDRGDRRADRLDPIGRRRRGARDRTGQRHHP